MVRAKILLVTMSVLTLFIMCGGCERHERRDDEWQDRPSQSERERSERDQDKNSESHEERHEEQH